jgi:ABC-type transport system involved in multi-copper enzyme maturation permease subunit
VSAILTRLILLAGLILVAAIIAVTRRAWGPALGHAFPSIWRVAKITVAEARRRRVVQAVIILVVVILLSMTFFSYLSPEEQSRMIISGGLAAITVFGILLAIFIAAFLIPHEIETRTVYAILSKPVRRFEFVLGKYLGALILLGVITAILTAVLVVVLLIQQRLVPSSPESVFNPNLGPVLFAAFMNYCALAVLTALIILISTISSTTMTVISAFIIWGVGSLQSTLNDLAEHATGGARVLMLVIYYIIPKLENFDFRHEAANFMPISMVSGWQAVLQGILYAAVVLLLATIFFNDRQV